MKEAFVVDSVEVNGEDITDKLLSRVFSSKYAFRSALSEVTEKLYGAEVTDVDTAADFGEEGDGIFILTKPEIDIEATGGYRNVYDNGIVPDVELEENILYKTVKQVLNESTTLKYRGHSFVLNVKANSDPTKDGLSVRLVPPFGELTPTEQSDITQDILQRLNDGLSKYGLIANIDTQVKDKSQIAYFLYTDGFKRMIRQALQNSNRDNTASDVQQPTEQPEGEQQDL